MGSDLNSRIKHVFCRVAEGMSTAFKSPSDGSPYTPATANTACDSYTKQAIMLHVKKSEALRIAAFHLDSQLGDLALHEAVHTQFEAKNLLARAAFLDAQEGRIYSLKAMTMRGALAEIDAISRVASSTTELGNLAGAWAGILKEVSSTLGAQTAFVARAFVGINRLDKVADLFESIRDAEDDVDVECALSLAAIDAKQLASGMSRKAVGRSA